MLKVGDTIKCSSAEEAVNHMTALEKEGVETDFLYEKDGEKGIWLEVQKATEKGDFEKEKSDLKEEISDLLNDIRAVKQENQELKDRIAELNDEITDLNMDDNDLINNMVSLLDESRGDLLEIELNLNNYTVKVSMRRKGR